MTEFSGFRYAFLSITRVAAIPPRARSYLAGLVGMTAAFEVKSGGVFFGGAAATKPPSYPTGASSFRPERSGVEEPLPRRCPQRRTRTTVVARSLLRTAAYSKPRLLVMF
ncbi:MAG: hypothetical protein LBK47_08725 [Prevotellaceae bacterium]|jgi:hypothetical protein|nr:hypothetical protein [Prevotellaceae bacterium]